MKTCQKGFISPLLLALIAVLLASGGVYWFQHTNQRFTSQINLGDIYAPEQATGANVVLNPKMTDWIMIGDPSLDFTFRVPPQFNQDPYDPKGPRGTFVRIGDVYYRSIGVTGTSTTHWSINADAVGGTCSIRNANRWNRDDFIGNATSTNTVNIGGMTFYKVVVSEGCATDTCSGYIEYVQPTGPGRCRSVLFYHVWSNGHPQVISSEGFYENNLSAEEQQQIAANDSQIDNTILALIPKIINTIQLKGTSR